MDKVAKIAEYLGYWLKELVEMFRNTLEWFEGLNLGGEEATDAE